MATIRHIGYSSCLWCNVDATACPCTSVMAAARVRRGQHERSGNGSRCETAVGHSGWRILDQRATGVHAFLQRGRQRRESGRGGAEARRDAPAKVWPLVPLVRHAARPRSSPSVVPSMGRWARLQARGTTRPLARAPDAPIAEAVSGPRAVRSVPEDRALSHSSSLRRHDPARCSGE
jgi:hypothetical protein